MYDKEIVLDILHKIDEAITVINQRTETNNISKNVT